MVLRHSVQYHELPLSLLECGCWIKGPVSLDAAHTGLFLSDTFSLTHIQLSRTQYFIFFCDEALYGAMSS